MDSLLPPWFYIHIQPLQGYPVNTPRSEMELRPYAKPTPSRYPVLGFHKEPDWSDGREDHTGDVLLLFDDGTKVRPIKQDQAVRCELYCKVCSDRRRKERAERDAQSA